MAQDLPTEPQFAEIPPEKLTSEEKNWGMLCHLTALLGYFAGFLSFVGPLICWLVKKDSSSFVAYHGRESLNFQLNILSYILISIPIGIVTCGLGFLLTVAVCIYGIVMPIIAGIKAGSGERYRYPLTFRIVT
jgi:uncharacterized Tic20 family protein